MYPGGSGMKVHEFIHYSDGTEAPKRQEATGLPSWFEDKFSGYIPGTQSGMCGPVVSFFRRIDSQKRNYW